MFYNGGGVGGAKSSMRGFWIRFGPVPRLLPAVKKKLLFYDVTWYIREVGPKKGPLYA